MRTAAVIAPMDLVGFVFHIFDSFNNVFPDYVLISVYIYSFNEGEASFVVCHSMDLASGKWREWFRSWLDKIPAVSKTQTKAAITPTASAVTTVTTTNASNTMKKKKKKKKKIKEAAEKDAEASQSPKFVRRRKRSRADETDPLLSPSPKRALRRSRRNSCRTYSRSDS